MPWTLQLVKQTWTNQKVDLIVAYAMDALACETDMDGSECQQLFHLRVISNDDGKLQ